MHGNKITRQRDSNFRNLGRVRETFGPLTLSAHENGSGQLVLTARQAIAVTALSVTAEPPPAAVVSPSEKP